MATIENANPGSFAEQLRNMDKSQVLAQELVQQGAIHAISTLLAHGCTKATARAMQDSLRTQAGLIRSEIERRDTVPLFPDDQVVAEHGQDADDIAFSRGVCVALQVVTSMDQAVLWREIVLACDEEKLLYFAAHIEPEEWELAGFAQYAAGELQCDKPAAQAQGGPNG